MKRFLALAALVLGMVSCQTEPEGLDVIVGGEQEAVINVSLAEATRTSADSGIVNVDNNVYDLRYILEVYDTASTTCVYRDVQTVATGVKTVSFPVRLIPERDYNFVVWADFVTNDSENDRYYTTTNGLDEVSIIPGMWVQMEEARDAYTGHEIVTGYNSGKSINITLTRPFGKLRVITTDIDALNKLIGKPMPESITVTYTNQVYTAFDALTQTPMTEDNKSYTYDLANVYKEDWNTENRTLFTDYIFGTESGSIQFTMDVAMTNGNVVRNNFNTEIPVKRNYLTTITGDILTDGNNIKVDVSDGFENAGGTDPDYEHSTISSDAEFLAALNADGKFIVISDLHIKDKVITPGLLSTRAGEATGNVSTINLNGYTITVENNTGAALATVYAGNTLFLEGGNIVLAEGSNASFIKNEGNVVLTSGEINNNSDVAPVVAGTIVVNKGAELSDDMVADENKITVNEENDGWLADVLANGGTYVFTEDMTASEIIVVAADNVVLDGNGKTLTSSAGRAINVSGAQNVTIKNLNIVASGERAINVIQNSKNVTIENVTATAANYTVNVASSAPGAVVAITNSTLNGLCTVNVASAGANVTVDGSTVNCNDNNTTEGESYAALCLNKEAVGGKIIATNSTINVTEGSDSTAGRNGAEDGVVTINGSDKDVVVTYAVITYTGSDYYYGFQTIAAAVEFAESGDTISLIRNVELTEPLIIAEDKNVVLNLNGKTITGTMAKSVGHVVKNFGTLTIKNGTISSTGANGGSALYNEGTLTVENVTINGSSIRENGGWPSYPINNYSSMTVTNSTINGYQGAIACNAAGTTTVNNCTINKEYLDTSSHVFYIDHADAKVIVNGGTYTHKGMDGSLAYVITGEITVNDGTFNTEGGGYGIAPLKNGKVTINGGTFNAGLLNWSGSIVVTGGTFKADPTSYLAEGYYASKNGNYYEVKEGSLVSNAEALAAAFDKGGEVTLTDDITLSETVVIEEGKTVNLNLNGKTITGAFVKGNGAIIENNGTLTIVGGTIKNTEINGDAVINNTGELVLEDVNIEGAPIGTTGYPNYAVYTSGKLIVNDGTQIISDRGVLYMKNGADVTINGGEFVVTDNIGTRVLTAHVIYAYGNSSKLTINDGNFEMNIGNGGGSSVICPAGATIKVYGGNFYHKPVTDGQSGCFQNYMGYGAPVDVYGGTFNDNTVTKSGNLAAGYEAVEDNGLWTVVAK